ncbi:hypothetical protein DDZ14_07535 [Maritimibacter sp. 55A14]|uniref:lysylphosphatidylglycerol synthase transmembrane domain-containing protein n=1 Tax=Maritimibacter sp. 55A14 TaxID=2174844 RepID=UPI000D61D2EA|nr:lysylphosphatidylglycerol synthase transmembrane domain-containing protein [Maritimibacter sp. 55A14]PWE32934.1 hypothetical protein DDZ14_07535 [Maritimibacter sp. 55A14]
MTGAPTQAAARRRWLIRLCGSALLLAGLFWVLPMDAVLGALTSIPLAVFAAVLALFLAAHVGAALKWWGLLSRAIPVPLALRAHYAGLAANLCLPGAVGGDAVRAGLAHGALRDGPRVVAAGAADRLIDMAALLAISLFGLLIAQQSGPGAGLVLQAGLILAGVTLGFAALPRLLPALWRIAPGLPGRGMAERLTAAFADLARHPLRLALALVASVAIQTALVLLSWWLARAAGADVAPALWIFAWPLAKIVAVLPVSLNGLGLREATLAAFLAPFGADPAVIVAAGLVWQAVLFAAGGIGALVLALSGRFVTTPPTDGKETAK